MIKTIKLPGRNDPCVCRSGKKFKVCCAGKIREQDDRLRKLFEPMDGLGEADKIRQYGGEAAVEEYRAGELTFEAYKTLQVQKMESWLKGRRGV